MTDPLSLAVMAHIHFCLLYIGDSRTNKLTRDVNPFMEHRGPRIVSKIKNTHSIVLEFRDE